MLIRSVLLFGLLVSTGVSVLHSQDNLPPGMIRKLGIEFDTRSLGRALADEVRVSGSITLPEVSGGASGFPFETEIHLKGGNVQVNHPALDNIQIFAGFRSFVNFTQSETSVAAFKKDVVATYNTSAGIHLIANPSGPGLIADRVLLSGFSHSRDGGKTWTSGFMPPLPGSIFTLGDPSVDVDRKGNFYFSGLGMDAKLHFTIQVNKSTDGGATWGPAVLVKADEGGDKEWIAVGPDPFVRSRDNVYVTWTSFQDTGAELRFGRSVDGGATWTTKTIFAPAPDKNPTHPQNFLQFSNPVVDHRTGVLYVPFIQFSNADSDFIRVLISRDGGESFSFATFHVPGAPATTVLPVVQSGELIECGADRIVPPAPAKPFFVPNLRLTIHSGPNVGGSLTGLARYVNASRLVTQPAFAARGGVLFLAWSNSTSNFFGDPAGRSNVFFIRSDDGGGTWTRPVRVNPDLAADVHHVLPALTLDTKSEGDSDEDDEDDVGVHIAYYTQHSNGTVDVDLAKSEDRGNTFLNENAARLTSTPFTLAPTNIPLPTKTNPFNTTNYDRQIQQCYNLGEYLSVRSSGNLVLALWGDDRNTVKQPVNTLDPISGQTHSQEDVFFQAVKAK